MKTKLIALTLINDLKKVRKQVLNIPENNDHEPGCNPRVIEDVLKQISDFLLSESTNDENCSIDTVPIIKSGISAEELNIVIFSCKQALKKMEREQKKLFVKKNLKPHNRFT